MSKFKSESGDVYIPKNCSECNMCIILKGTVFVKLNVKKPGDVLTNQSKSKKHVMQVISHSFMKRQSDSKLF